MGLAGNAQAPNLKFGKVTLADFANKVYSIDSSANAVVIAEMGSTDIVGNNKGWFSFEFKCYRRIHILNKAGYDEANVVIPLYKSTGAEQKLESIKGVTYHVENGKVIETKLEKDQIFTEKYDRNYLSKKFTMPNVKEGCIIEYEYKITSDFLNTLRAWTFQGESPRLWSEYRLGLPQFFNYVFLTQGYHPYFINERENNVQHYTVLISEGTSASERVDIKANVTDYRWVMKDVPSLKIESFTSTVSNYISKIQFQLNAIQQPLTYQRVMDTWPGLTKHLLEDEDFGKTLNNSNNWLNDVKRAILTGSENEMEKAKKLFAYVRDNITCTDHDAIYASQQLKNVLKTKNGTVSDVNLLLTAMLLDAGIETEPVMLSTKENGVTFPLYPILDRFNYVIAQATINGTKYYLDASQPRLGFGKLLPDCYNGHARVVNKEAAVLELNADELKEAKVTSVFITNNDKGKWVGTMTARPGYYESYRIRKALQESGKESYFKEVKKDFGYDITVEDPLIDSISRYDDPVLVKYNFTLNLDGEDILYINPLFGEALRENPFKSAERFYPVEMPYTFDETFIATLEVPAGYEVDELPKPIRLKFNEEGDGMFEYLISQSGTSISLRSRVYMKRATYVPQEYEVLREFFNMIVNKQKEQIVFKKKK
jgi:hypothetical protein